MMIKASEGGRGPPFSGAVFVFHHIRTSTNLTKNSRVLLFFFSHEYDTIRQIWLGGTYRLLSDGGVHRPRKWIGQGQTWGPAQSSHQTKRRISPCQRKVAGQEPNRKRCCRAKHWNRHRRIKNIPPLTPPSTHSIALIPRFLKINKKSQRINKKSQRHPLRLRPNCTHPFCIKSCRHLQPCTNRTTPNTKLSPHFPRVPRFVGTTRQQPWATKKLNWQRVKPNWWHPKTKSCWWQLLYWGLATMVQKKHRCPVPNHLLYPSFTPPTDTNVWLIPMPSPPWHCWKRKRVPF